MPKFQKNPMIVEATQWFKLGDHPDVVPYTNRSNKENHGWIKTLEGGHIVTPGDWIITGIKGEQYPCKPDIFEKIYTKILE